eukprot:108092-Lingulodinium_polyedra.AAC.1
MAGHLRRTWCQLKCVLGLAYIGRHTWRCWLPRAVRCSPSQPRTLWICDGCGPIWRPLMVPGTCGCGAGAAWVGRSLSAPRHKALDS